MSAGQVIASALSVLAGTVSSMYAALEMRKPVPKATVRLWVNRLRQAADKLEELL